MEKKIVLIRSIISYIINHKRKITHENEILYKIGNSSVGDDEEPGDRPRDRLVNPIGFPSLATRRRIQATSASGYHLQIAEPPNLIEPILNERDRSRGEWERKKEKERGMNDRRDRVNRVEERKEREKKYGKTRNWRVVAATTTAPACLQSLSAIRHYGARNNHLTFLLARYVIHFFLLLLILACAPSSLLRDVIYSWHFSLSIGCPYACSWNTMFLKPRVRFRCNFEIVWTAYTCIEYNIMYNRGWFHPGPRKR